MAPRVPFSGPVSWILGPGFGVSLGKLYSDSDEERENIEDMMTHS